MEDAFDYLNAIYGLPDNVVERYGLYFDNRNYQRAMANEFERRRYAQTTLSVIKDKAKTVNFNKLFSLVGEARLGEYSFASGAFPMVRTPDFSICINLEPYMRGPGICYGGFLNVSVFKLSNAVNSKDFDWSLRMAPDKAQAFVQNRASKYGSINRMVTLRVTYAIVNKKGADSGASSFSPFIDSAEIFTDASLSTSLGHVTKISTQGPRTADEWRLRSDAAQTSGNTLGTYSYIASYRNEYYRKPNTPFLGTIALTDGGIAITGEQPDGSTKAATFKFYDLFDGASRHAKAYGGKPEMRLWRYNGSSDCAVRIKSTDEMSLTFAERSERDRFFSDLTGAISAWTAKYPEFAAAPLGIEQRCENGGHWMGPCEPPTAAGDSQPHPSP